MMVQKSRSKKPVLPTVPNDRRKRRTISQKDQVEFWTSEGIFIPRRMIYLGAVHSDAEGNESATDASLFKRLLNGLEVLEYFGPKDPITIVMNNPGGGWYHGMALYDRIRNSSCEITIEGYGHVMSMASVIFQAAHKRLLARHSTMLLHYGTDYFDGHSKDLTRKAREAERLNTLMEDIFLRQINKKRKLDGLTDLERSELTKIMDFDYYIDANTAIKLGLADGFVRRSLSLPSVDDEEP